jgi:hypothetical protein
MLVAPQRYKGTSFSDKGPTRLCLLTCTAIKQMLVAPQRYKGTSFSEKGPTRLCLLTCTATRLKHNKDFEDVNQPKFNATKEFCVQMLVAPQRYKGTSFSEKGPTRLCLLTCTAIKQMLVAPQRYKGTSFSEKGPTRLCLLTCTAIKQMLVAPQRYKGTSFSEKGQHGFLTSFASHPATPGREKEGEILLYHDQDSVWPRRGMNKR